MFDYVKTASTAQRLIERFGLPVVVLRQSSIYDPATGAAEVVSASFDTHGIFIQIEESAATEANASGLQRQARVSGIGSRLIEQVLVLTSAVRPVEGDKVTAGGASYDVLTVEPVAPAGMAVMYRTRVKAN